MFVHKELLVRFVWLIFLRVYRPSQKTAKTLEQTVSPKPVAFPWSGSSFQLNRNQKPNDWWVKGRSLPSHSVSGHNALRTGQNGVHHSCALAVVHFLKPAKHSASALRHLFCCERRSSVGHFSPTGEEAEPEIGALSTISRD